MNIKMANDELTIIGKGFIILGALNQNKDEDAKIIITPYLGRLGFAEFLSFEVESSNISIVKRIKYTFDRSKGKIGVYRILLSNDISEESKIKINTFLDFIAVIKKSKRVRYPRRRIYSRPTKKYWVSSYRRRFFTLRHRMRKPQYFLQGLTPLSGCADCSCDCGSDCGTDCSCDCPCDCYCDCGGDCTACDCPCHEDCESCYDDCSCESCGCDCNDCDCQDCQECDCGDCDCDCDCDCGG